MKKKLGIFEEVAYSYRLMQRLNQIAKSLYMVYSFSEKNSIEKFLENEKLDVLLVGEELLEDIEKLKLDCEIIVLQESENKQQNGIFKYQAASIILHQLNGMLNISVKGKNEEYKVKIYGVYSPIRRCGKTKTAVAIANKLAEKSNVLLLNLEPFSMIKPDREGDMTLSDVFYYLEQDRNNDEVLSKAIVDCGSIKMIPPTESPVDIQEIDDERWNQFFVKLTSRNDIDEIVIDFDECISCFLHLFELCDRVFMPVLEEAASLDRFRNFQNFLQKSISESVQKKIYKLQFPLLSNQDIGIIDQIIYRILEELKFDE